MADNERWLLPEGVEEILPQQAYQVEQLRRQLLDLFSTWGYELVIPPLVEYLDSLYVGTGNDLELSTFKLVDQLNGRLMGVRADITPQVARIDAHRLQKEQVVRLCYYGIVLLTRSRELGGSRCPLQIGAELYGHRGIDADVEILQLMLAALRVATVNPLYLDLGHVAIFRNLVQYAELNSDQERTLFDALQRKASTEISQLVESISNQSAAQMLMALVELNGEDDVLDRASKVLGPAPDDVHTSLENLNLVSRALLDKNPLLTIHYDLAELRGYHYHTGAVFSVYVPEFSQAIAQGGRYDDIGLAFGRARAATGFSLDVRALLARQPLVNIVATEAIFAPAQNDVSLDAMINDLRQQGKRVIKALDHQTGTAQDLDCSSRLVKQNNQWKIEQIEN